MNAPAPPKNSTANPPAPEDDRSQKLLRSQVVHALSDTANGCLTELGYFPGILNQLKQMEQLNARYKSDVANLQANNRQLQQSLAVHDRNAGFLKAPESLKMQHLKELEGKIRFLTDENRVWATQHSILAKKRQQLFSEFERLQNAHRYALNEITFLRGQVTSSPKQAPPKSGGKNAVILHPQVAGMQTQSHVPNGHGVVAQQSGPTAINTTRLYTMPPMPEPQPVPIHQAYGNSSYPPPARTVSSNAFPGPSSYPYRPLPSTHMFHTSNVPFRTPAPVNYCQQMPPSARPEASALFHSSVTTFATSTRSKSLTTTPGTQDASLPHAVIGNSRNSVTPSTPTMSIGNHPSPIEAFEAITPVDAGTPAADSAAILSYYPDREVPLLAHKRSNEQMLDGAQFSAGGIRKKLRLEPDLQFQAEVKVGHQNGNWPDGGKSDSGSMGVGADGLRLPEHCVAEIMEEDENEAGSFSCQICNVRFKEGLILEAPKPFIRATQSQLMEHCMNEHPAAWELLRKM